MTEIPFPPWVVWYLAIGLHLWGYAEGKCGRPWWAMIALVAWPLVFPARLILVWVERRLARKGSL